jgi:hypothetical protein
MEAHRHRVHPVLWEALANRRAGRDPGPVVRRELDAWRDRRAAYLARRPAFAFGDDEPPWGRA